MIHELTLAQRKRLYAKLSVEWLIGKSCAKCGSKHNLAVHHKNGRLGALLTYTPLFIALCPKCHDWVHNRNPEGARKLGLLCERGCWNTMPK